MIDRVLLLALPNMLVSSAAIPAEMLVASRSLLKVQRSSQADFPLTVVGDLSVHNGLNNENEPGQVSTPQVPTINGWPMPVECSLEQSEADHQRTLIIIPALWRKPTQVLAQQQKAIDWLARHQRRGAILFAIGTGVCLLAESGMLNGKPATTHWHYLDQFARDYPLVNLQRRHLLTQSGRIYCAASVNSGADMMVHVLGQIFDRQLALKVEQQFSPEVRQTFDTQVFSLDNLGQHADEAIAQAQAWLQHNLHQPLDLAQLAQRAGLSARQFDRRFKQVAGTTPGKYLQQLRMKKARELLQGSNLAIADIGAMCGYSDSSYFVRVFHKLAGQTPGQFRAKVGSKVFRA